MAFDVDLAVARGGRQIAVRFETQARVVSLFGPSGAGKTSVLDMVAGLLRPAAGHVRVDGETLFDAAQGIALPPERRGVGYVPQDARLFPHMNVRDNLLYGWRLTAPARRWLALEEALDLLGIGHLPDRRPATLSGGEAQRVALGRALLAGPRVLLLDEPLASLDRARREEIMAMLERIRDDLKIPIIHVSHDRAEVDRLGGLVVEMG
ncbi:ATP-binding cassette domain-containing protein [Alteraurantiacibacter buctensis]|uniref:ATP-binding cassette domain-containing protein n=1 Tax=Alteraurantiacibacter buctensis TaxID=1503981 RepID=A0A844YW52_9SPHN|nr:ATP-binding cassette domain-containing protein [Alteraurantiacibacter buctensis]MXO70704.1 ATP-binding cassette domain-containing protein [Alteraurantiacibacter buctensis]